MREKIRDKGRIEHIIESIDNIFEFTENISLEQFATNKMMWFAVFKNLEIIGEASYMITNELREKYTEIEWKKIIGLRHILVHGYYTINANIVWKILENDLCTLREKIKCIYEQEYMNNEK